MSIIKQLTRVVSAAGLLILAVGSQAVPVQVPYSGQLAENGELVNGTKTMQFQILGGTAVAYDSGSLNVSVSHGAFRVLLGAPDTSPLDSSVFTRTGLRLRVFVGETALSPDQDIHYVPHSAYAIGAQSATLLDGMPSSSFAASAHTHSANDIVSGVLSMAIGGLGFDSSSVPHGSILTKGSSGWQADTPAQAGQLLTAQGSPPQAFWGNAMNVIAAGSGISLEPPTATDPNGRVKVKFHWDSSGISDQENTWARVQTFGAGIRFADRGFFMLPEVNDEVLVAFENGDIHHPYVIGSLWSTATPPAPHGVSRHVKGGDAAGPNGDGGKVVVRTGRAAGDGLPGKVVFQGDSPQTQVTMEFSPGPYTAATPSVFKIADNANPDPLDRILFNYDYFSGPQWRGTAQGSISGNAATANDAGRLGGRPAAEYALKSDLTDYGRLDLANSWNSQQSFADGIRVGDWTLESSSPTLLTFASGSPGGVPLHLTHEAQANGVIAVSFELKDSTSDPASLRLKAANGANGGDVILEPGTATAGGVDGKVTVRGKLEVLNATTVNRLAVNGDLTVNAGTLSLDQTSSLDVNGSLSLPPTGITGAGRGSGLDADRLDGLDSAVFGRVDLANAWGPQQSFANGMRVGNWTLESPSPTTFIIGNDAPAVANVRLDLDFVRSANGTVEVKYALRDTESDPAGISLHFKAADGSNGGDIILEPGHAPPGGVDGKIRVAGNLDVSGGGTFSSIGVNGNLTVTSGTLSLDAASSLTVGGALSLPSAGITGAGRGSGLDADNLDGYSWHNHPLTRKLRATSSLDNGNNENWNFGAGIRLQGSLTDTAGQPLNGLQTVTVLLYRVPAGGSPLYSEAFNVDLEAGVLDVVIGAGVGTSSGDLRTALVPPIDPDNPAPFEPYLTVRVVGEPELAPRHRLVSVPYAVIARRAETLGGEPASAFARLNSSASQTFAGPTTFATAPTFSAPGSSAPFQVSSSTRVDNLNADRIDGVSSEAFARLDLANLFTEPQTFLSRATFSGSGAPFTVTSSTKVENLHADKLDGLDWLTHPHLKDPSAWTLAPGAASGAVLRLDGILADPSGNPREGSVDVEFRLYDSPSGGTPLWEESKTVEVSNGAFSVTLGDPASSSRPLDGSLFSSGSRYIAMRVEPDTEELSPRRRIGTVPLALHAANAGSLGDQPAGAYARLDLPNAFERYQVFKGEVVSVEPDFDLGDESPLRIRAYDQSHRLHLGRRSRAFDDATDEMVIEALGTGTDRPGASLRLQAEDGAGTDKPGGGITFVAGLGTGTASDGRVTVRGNFDVSGTSTASSFVGNGSGLMGLDASQLGDGTVADARLSANIARLNQANTWSGTQTLGGGADFGNVNVSGSGSMLTLASAGVRLETEFQATPAMVMFRPERITPAPAGPAASLLLAGETATEMDQNGGNTILQGGSPMGTGLAGSVIARQNAAGASRANIFEVETRSQVDHFWVDESGVVHWTGTAQGNAATATTATTAQQASNADTLDGFDTAMTFTAAPRLYVSRADGFLPAGTVDSASICDGCLTAADLGTDCVGADEIAANSVGSSELCDDCITSDDLAADCVRASELADNAVDSAALQNNCVTSPKIAPGAVTGDKLASPLYWVGDQRISTPAQVYCDMTSDGGGWTMLYFGDQADHQFFKASKSAGGVITDLMTVDREGDVNVAGTLSAGNVSGNGAGLTSLNASALTTGTVSPARGGIGLDTSAAAAGSILRAGGSGTWQTLAPGTPGQVLKMSGGLPQWGTDETGGGGGGGTVTSITAGTGLVTSPSSGITTSGSISINTAVVPQLDSANIFTRPQTMLSGTASSTPLVVQGAAGQAATLQEWRDDQGGVPASVSSAGVLTARGAGFSGDVTVNGSSLQVLGGNVLVNGGDLLAFGNAMLGSPGGAVTIRGTLQGPQPLTMEGGVVDGNTTTLAVDEPTAARTLTLPDASGTVGLVAAHTENVSTTPSARGKTIICLDGYVAPTTITDLADAVDGQVIVLVAGNNPAPPSVADDNSPTPGNFRLRGNSDWQALPNHTLTLARVNGTWFETARSQN